MVIYQHGSLNILRSDEYVSVYTQVDNQQESVPHS